MIAAKIDVEWSERQPTDYSLCSECRDIITGKMSIGYLFINNENSGGSLKLCEPCRYEMTNEPAAET